MVVLFFYFFGSICPKWITLDQIGFPVYQWQPPKLKTYCSLIPGSQTCWLFALIYSKNRIRNVFVQSNPDNPSNTAIMNLLSNSANYFLGLKIHKSPLSSWCVKAAWRAKAEGAHYIFSKFRWHFCVYVHIGQ